MSPLKISLIAVLVSGCATPKITPECTEFKAVAPLPISSKSDQLSEWMTKYQLTYCKYGKLTEKQKKACSDLLSEIN